MSTLEIRNVSKSYGPVQALNQVSLTLREGKITGLLGRNGAGKTTLLGLMTGKLFPDGGTLQLDGKILTENDEALGNIAIMMEQTCHPDSMRVREAISWGVRFYPLFETGYALELCRLFELDPCRKVKALSTGYKSIFKAVLTLSSGAPVLLFDEPVLGLDAHHRELMYQEILKRYTAYTPTILISTHLIDEAADILEEVVILDKGNVLLHQPLDLLFSEVYAVSGEKGALETFIQGRRCLSRNVLGPIAQALIHEPWDEEAKKLARTLKLEKSAPELQKIFISMTQPKQGGQS